MLQSDRKGFGFRQTMTVGNTPATGGQSEFQIQTAPGKSTFKGDPVNIQSAGHQGFLQNAAQATMDDGVVGGKAWSNAVSGTGDIAGVFNGAFYIDSTGKPTFANSVVAGVTTSKDYNTGSDNITAFANTNPAQEYSVRLNAALAGSAAAAQALLNSVNFFNPIDEVDGDAIDGLTRITLSVATNGASATNGMFRLVRNANIEEQDDLLTAGAQVIVVIQPASALYN